MMKRSTIERTLSSHRLPTNQDRSARMSNYYDEKMKRMRSKTPRAGSMSLLNKYGMMNDYNQMKRADSSARLNKKFTSPDNSLDLGHKNYPHFDKEVRKTSSHINQDQAD